MKKFFNIIFQAKIVLKIEGVIAASHSNFSTVALDKVRLQIRMNEIAAIAQLIASEEIE